MTPHAIVSYDDTQNDRDALMLGATLRDAGARLTLAYVRHSVHRCPDDEELSHHGAHALLERGAGWLEEPEVPRRVVMNASTGEGLASLAAASRPTSSSSALTTAPGAGIWPSGARRRRCSRAD